MGLPAAAGGANCPLLSAIVNVKLGPPLGLYFSFSILLVFSSFFLHFSEHLLAIYGFSIAIDFRIQGHFLGFF